MEQKNCIQCKDKPTPTYYCKYCQDSLVCRKCHTRGYCYNEMKTITMVRMQQRIKSLEKYIVGLKQV